MVRCTAGILDIQFSPHKPSLLACAQADGSISVHGLCSEPEIWLVSECQSWTPPPATVILALAWHPGIPDIIGVTRADGGIELLRLSHGEDIQSGLYGLSIVPEPRRHDDQVWSIVFVPGGAAGLGIPVNGHNFNLYSGGDDSMIQGLMFAQPGDQTWVGEQLDGIQRCHRAGVTTLLLLPRVLGMTHNHILLTGSYDDCVRIVDPTRGDILCERNLGGSVWRLRLMRRYADYEAAAAAAENRSGRKEFLVLACCMEEGARILRVSIVPEDHTYIIDVLQVFKRDQTLCYGGDVQPRSTEEREQNALYRIITTSFYDRKMFQWEFHDDQSNGQVPVPSKSSVPMAYGISLIEIWFVTLSTKLTSVVLSNTMRCPAAGRPKFLSASPSIHSSIRSIYDLTERQ